MEGLEREQLFDVARQFPLLTADQEIGLDRKKWLAAGKMLGVFVDDPAARQYLADWLTGCSDHPPAVGTLRPREHYYLLRREMTDFLPGGAQADQLTTLTAILRQQQTGVIDPQSLAIPPSLTAGLAAVMLRHSDCRVNCNVADAIQSWEQRWPQAPWQEGAALAGRGRRVLVAQRRAYLEARDTLVLHNLRLVYTIAGRHRGKGVAFPDLVQEGIFGLIRAAEKYDHSKGFRFSTYSFNWITQAVRRAVGNHGGLIRYPTHVQEKVSKLYREKIEWQARSGVEPADTELATASGLTLAETRDLLKLRNQAYSLDGSPGEDSGSLYDVLPVSAADEAARPAELHSLRRLIIDELGESLEPVEQDVIIARWGLRHDRPLSRAEMADRLRVSTERVRQLENSALSKLQLNPELRSTFEAYQPGSRE
jgi:RNA polymerase sigma factor (sigma-70 family)